VQDCGDIGVVDPRLNEHGAHDVLHDDGVAAYSGSGGDERFTAIPECEVGAVAGVVVHGDVA
jgi:hypothetical protein